jgi:hypothetical protein
MYIYVTNNTPTLNNTMIDLTKFKRSEIRYALYRCRSGGPDEVHLDIFNHFSDALLSYGLTISTFPATWDISESKPYEIVSGHLLIPLQARIESSLFNSDGSLK